MFFFIRKAVCSDAISFFFFLREVVCVSVLALGSYLFPNVPTLAHSSAERALSLTGCFNTSFTRNIVFGPTKKKEKKKSLSNTCALVCGSGHLPVKEHARGQLRTTTHTQCFRRSDSKDAFHTGSVGGSWPRGGGGRTTADGCCLLSFES